MLNREELIMKREFICKIMKNIMTIQDEVKSKV